ncbi:LysR family transcriptional regulator [Parasphingorhabdus sp. DH2-15]|uniref:LysR family transcriptional regulator n=1 Tax=Parasphingorhabdus sp. DH2-15 TaxID=3444112 RepID=UPI003F682AD3
MERQQLSDLTIFTEVARAQGFRAAASRLNLQAGSISEAVQRFEDRLGVRLFERSTRSVALTAAGERLYSRSLPALSDLEIAIRELDEDKDLITGTLKLSAPYSAGPFFLDRLIAQFAKKFPDIQIELIYNDAKVDLVTSGIDAAIRSNTLLEQDTHAVPLGPKLKMAVVASPEYLAEKGTPEKPDDLLDHDGIFFAFGSSGNVAPWSFQGQGDPRLVSPKRRFVINNLRSMVELAENGLGVTYVYREAVRDAIEHGRLVSLFANEVPELPRYSLNYRTKRHMPPRLRAFIDLAKKISL